MSKGKEAITNYKTLEIFENQKTPTFSFVECKLETGRTHQIRVHMSYKGNHILGDKQYKSFPPLAISFIGKSCPIFI